MKFSTLLNACSIAVLSFIPLASAEDSSSPATVTFLYSASSSSGQTTTNLYLVESAHGYGMSIGGDEPTISASIENDTMVMICPYSGLQAALVPAADNVTWYLEWVAEDTVLPDGSKTDAFAIGDAVGWSQSTNVTVDTTVCVHRVSPQGLHLNHFTVVDRGWNVGRSSPTPNICLPCECRIYCVSLFTRVFLTRL